MSRRRLGFVLGLDQLLAWAVTFYLPAVIVTPASASLHASHAAIVGGFSWALLVAGMAAPRVGKRIERVGGRGVLAVGVVVMAAGLAVLAVSRGLALWYAGWTVLGAGMAMGLYDAAFATAGRLLGSEARRVITGVTLMAGFASTLGWPAGTALVGSLGWRAMLLLYAALLLVVNLPLVLALVPPAGPPLPVAPPEPGTDGGRARRFTLACLAGFFTLRWLITSALAVYILRLLPGIGLSRGHAVLVAALIGPGQVAGRLLELAFGARIGLLAGARLGALLLPAAVALLLAGGPAVAIGFALLYGMSNGILTIHRGTLPLALFGPAGYATLLGWLAVPVWLAQALAPTLAAPLVAALPPDSVFLLAGVLGVVAMLLLAPLRLPARG